MRLFLRNCGKAAKRFLFLIVAVNCDGEPIAERQIWFFSFPTEWDACN